uniref:Rhodanese domain-containing protein n=1 Tax=Neolamprologus brichardi TaxID=32507 RepID=A0A3Q4H2K1_NEOBR
IESCESDSPTIVIIGCGVSGIAAAHRLVKAGYDHVRILEATGRSGGRIKTATLGKFICSFCFSRFRHHAVP